MKPGTKLGRYEILCHLASGGMAEVLLARVQGVGGFERHVVLKRIKGDQAKDERFVNMFIDEARLAASLDHRNVIQTFDIGEEKDELFFAMEYVHGEDARKLLMHLHQKQETLPLQHVFTIVCSALAGLHHAHEHELKIVHRDVSPANIMISQDGNVKVADFGIAKAALRTQETRSGTLKGKVSYMSPEQCMGGVVDRRSDVFAMGIVLYELATVRRLFKGETDFMTMTTIVQGNIPKPRTVRPDLPVELEAIIMKALAPRVADRWQTAEAMGEALEELAHALKIQISEHALGAFMKQQFGDRPEPWLVPRAEPEIELTIDFDGGVNGIAPFAVLPEDIDFADSAPIAHAQANAGLGAAWNGATTEPTASGTPIAWSPEPRVVAPATSRKWLYGAIAGVIAGAVVLFVVARSSDDAPVTPAASSTTPATSDPAPTPPEPAPAPDPAPDPAPPPPEPVASAAGSGSAAGSASPIVKKKPPPRRQPKTEPPPKWDSSRLFPKK